jgi:hypothetical protein
MRQKGHEKNRDLLGIADLQWEEDWRKETGDLAGVGARSRRIWLAFARGDNCRTGSRNEGAMKRIVHSARFACFPTSGKQSKLVSP